ncbi:transpeptidase-transglycosylase, partial [bacterium AH-315-L15]|nr:transpeptidase-transglycosylase [bacterium AH-315-L15]
ALQRAAEASVRVSLEELERDHPRLKRFEPDRDLQGALVAMDPKTGAVKALVGGRNYQKSQFNRVTDARRQPGSLFKPIVYLTAFDQAAKGGIPYTPISKVDDAPVTLQVGGKEWSPENYDKKYLGPLTLRAALEGSRNTATVRLSQEVGIDAIIQMAKKIGIESELQPLPSLALGSLEVTPLEMGVVYSTLANGGMRHRPQFVSGIVDPSGLPIEQEESEGFPSRRVVSAEASYLVTDIMKGVIENGTGRGVRRLGFHRPAAGKTGTTNQLRDGWFAGYTPELVTVVWVGFDQNKGGGFTGSSAAVPIWTRFMKEASYGEPTDFEIPSGIIIERVNENGVICHRDGIEVPFIKGTEPRQSCEKGFLKWIKRFFF